MSNKPTDPHFTMPFELRADGKTFNVVQQDSGDDLAGSIEVILRYPIGYREDNPDFGTPDLALRETTAEDDIPVEIRTAIGRWEPRVEVTASEREATDPMVRRIVVSMIEGEQNRA